MESKIARMSGMHHPTWGLREPGSSSSKVGCCQQPTVASRSSNLTDLRTTAISTQA